MTIRARTFAAICAAVAVSWGCGDDANDGSGSKPDADSSADESASSDGDASDSEGDGAIDAAADHDDVDDSGVVPREKPPASAFKELMAYDWELPAGKEQYYCVYKTVEEDVWLTDLEPIQPAGTHHVTLGFVENGPEDGVIEAGDPDAEVPCTGVSLGDQLIYSAVLNTPGISMPQGVALKVPAGSQLLLSVHIFNGTEEPMSGHTGVKVVQVDASDVKEHAENIFAMNLGIQVEPGESTQTSTCTMTADGTLLALTHHMHRTGVWQKTTLVRKGGEREVLLDEAFEFDNQTTEVLEAPVALETGDQLEIECQFNNATDMTFTFGESTFDNEMCLTSFYRFPAVATTFICAN